MEPEPSQINRIVSEIAKLAGLEFAHKVLLCDSTIGSSALDRIDPFFDSLGEWDAVNFVIKIDRGRCRRKCPAGCVPNALINTVIAHFCAKAVVHVGIHPKTEHQYIGWNAPGKQFSAENYTLRPTHQFYDALVREQELFTQIFTYLYLMARQNPDELNSFNFISQGHCELYDLNYSEPPNSRLVPNSLAKDWRRDGRADQAKLILGILTRGFPPSKDGMGIVDCDDIDS